MSLEALLFQATEEHPTQIEIVLDDHDLRCKHRVSLATLPESAAWPSSGRFTTVAVFMRGAFTKRFLFVSLARLDAC